MPTHHNLDQSADVRRLATDGVERKALQQQQSRAGLPILGFARTAQARSVECSKVTPGIGGIPDADKDIVAPMPPVDPARVVRAARQMKCINAGSHKGWLRG